MNEGRLGEAESLLAPSLVPGKNPEAWTMAGIIAARRGDPGAESLLRQAIAIDETALEPRIALTTVLSKMGWRDAAAAEAEALGNIAGSDVETLFHVGLVLIDAREFARAAEWFAKALALAPNQPEIRRNLALALRDAGQELQAVEVLMGLVAQEQSAANYLLLGQLQLAHGKLEAALASASEAVACEPTNSSALVLQGLALAELRRTKEAEKSLRAAIRSRPDDGIARAALGFWLQEQGEFKGARAELEKAIQIRPTHGFAYVNLFRAQRACARDEPRLAQMAKMAEDPRLNIRDRGYLHYALGKAREDLGNYETSMAHYVRANECAYDVWLSARPWDREEYAAKNAATREAFKEPRDHANGNKSDRPIFIVGMIRSGTSLLEQMVSSHSQVTGLGELPFWHERDSEDHSVENLRDLAVRYLDEAPTEGKFTDKMPHNFAMLGRILPPSHTLGFSTCVVIARTIASRSLPRPTSDRRCSPMIGKPLRSPTTSI